MNDPMISRRTPSLSDAALHMRWDPYVLAREHEFDAFWRDQITPTRGRMLFILGRGFDIRTLAALRRVIAAGAAPDVWLLAFDNGLEDSPARAAKTAANEAKLLGLVPAERIQRVPIGIAGTGGATETSRNTRTAIQAAGAVDGYDHVVVDISAMPRMVALTAIAKLLHDLDMLAASGGKNVNLHVTTAESITADLGAAKGTLRETVTHVVGFSGRLDAQETETWPRVWFPILGEAQRERLELIRQTIRPDEICPVIPFPSRQPRRGDEIVGEHREILFDNFQIEPANILLACEYNPFEAYKQLFHAMERYRVALKRLGGCKAFVSPISSKLLSVGALLACYDHRSIRTLDRLLDVGIHYVETAMYGDPEQQSAQPFELYSMWIRGDWEA